MNKKTPAITVENSRENYLRGAITIRPEDWLDPDRAKYLGERIKHLKTQMLRQFVEEQYTGRLFAIRFDEYPPSRWELETYTYTTYEPLSYRVKLTVSEVPRHDISLPYLEPVTESFWDLLKFKFWKWRRR